MFVQKAFLQIKSSESYLYIKNMQNQLSGVSVYI